MAYKASSTSRMSRVRVLLVQGRAKPLGGGALAVVLRRSVRIEDGFKVEREDFLMVRVEHDGGQS